MILGVDIGRNKAKAYSKDIKISFPSKVGEWRELRLNSGGDYVLDWGGLHFIGNLADESYCVREMATESKIHDETKLLFLTVLAVANQSEYNVVIGLPVDQHVAAVKESFTNLLSGRYTVRLNGAMRSFFVSNISIVPEGAGAYWSEVLNFQGQVINKEPTNGLFRGLDVGSRTINFYSIRDRKYIDKDSGTLPYGIIELENAGPEHKEQFTRRIVADLSKKWLTKSDRMLISGGGALLLHEYLIEHFPYCQISEDPVHANAKGFYKMGVARWGAN